LTETRNETVRVSLTRREQEVLTWLREGKRDAEIATILEISTKTVGKHVEHILAKTGAKNRTTAAMKGERHVFG
jgi:DNA-binding CsgD family transcriptional regulator